MLVNEALDAVGHMKWAWTFVVKDKRLIPKGVALLSQKQPILMAMCHTLPM